MVKKEVIWSVKAQQDRIQILEYWSDRNGTKNYSNKLNTLIVEAIDLIALFPFLGRQTNRKDIRIKILRHYQIVYKVKPKRIEILAVWDSRQDPEQLKEIINQIS